ncbi:MAG: NHLP family bacteriocin export ABC transporter peptidase/permease/ATPase subunit [Bacteroidaceae bacterium]|nr:NHLP family bacteriocin export ABC transporter peptidase/permease/ATPase subunit [Bacteroidaceae bacterium]
MASKSKKIVKVPVVIQMEAVECGAASLTMILAYFGKWLPLEEVREACGVSRDGSSAKSILQAARRYGLKAKGYRTNTESLNGLQPAIIHWNFEHFVVFRGIKNDKAYLNDPASGPVKVPLAEFNRSFTGVAMEFEPSEAFVKGGHQTSIISYIKKNMQGAKEAFWLTFILTLIGAFVGIATPLFTRIFFDDILSGKNTTWATWFFILMAILAVFNFILVMIRERYSKRVAGALALKGNVRFMQHLLRLPMNFFAMRNVGDLQQRQHMNETITHSLVNVIAPQLINIVLLLLYLSLMFSYSVTLSVVGIAAAAINLGIIQFLSNIRINMIRSMETSEAKYFSATISCIDNMESIKAAGAEAGFFEFWSGLWARKFNIHNNAHAMQLKIGLLPVLANGLVNTLVLILGTLLILKGELTIGMLMAFQGFMGAFITPVNAIVNANQTLIEMRSQMERVDDVMKYPEDRRGGDSKLAEGKLGGLVELKNVTFGYSPLQPPLIQNFNMRIEPGHSVAFVGSSGCGKSTLAKLISGLYKPWAGEILFDGRPIETISSEELTNSIGVIDQNVVLFDDTVAANIRMWDNSIEEFTMMMACNDAQIREDIISRPEGFATKIVKGGQNFSGGQRQRIEIATALAKEPAILIMDEATSALDPKTEDVLMEDIRRMGPTQIIIAHRLSTIRDCDEIIVMDQGHILQRGRHEELMGQEGLYQQLMKSE